MRGGTIFIPLRSMFEQMGATVSYDAASKTATVSQGRRAGRRDGRQAGGHDQRRVASARRAADRLSGRRARSGSRHFRRHGRVRAVGARPPSRGRSVHSGDAAADRGPRRRRRPKRRSHRRRLRRRRRIRSVLGGYFRSYYFTRQNASNNPGTQFDFTPGAKYNSNGVNQASWTNAIALHGEYDFPSGWDVGGTYLYSTSLTVRASSRRTTQRAPSAFRRSLPTRIRTIRCPAFTLSTFYEAYLGYKAHGFNGELGNVLFNSPWANPADSRVKPAAFEGAYLSYTTPSVLDG